MRFTITPQTKMSEIKTGDKVAFNFAPAEPSLLQDIKMLELRFNEMKKIALIIGSMIAGGIISAAGFTWF